MTVFVAYLFLALTISTLIHIFYERCSIKVQLFLEELSVIAIYLLLIVVFTVFLGRAFGLPYFEIKLIPHI